MSFVWSWFSVTDSDLSRELVRNAIAREKLERLKSAQQASNEYYDAQMKKLDDAVLMKRKAYANAARPLLDEFEDVGLAQHFYQEVVNATAAHANAISHMRDLEVNDYGYLSKKLVSVGLNMEALLVKLRRGLPFKEQLQAFREDAESSDVDLVAHPLVGYAVVGIPTPPTIRAAAFGLARALEDAVHKPTPVPMRGWLDFFKFRSYQSPLMMDKKCKEAVSSAKQLIEYVESEEYHRALELGEKYLAKKLVQGNEEYRAAFLHFKEAAMPTIAADVFERYMNTSISASRYACVEPLLKQ